MLPAVHSHFRVVLHGSAQRLLHNPEAYQEENGVDKPEDIITRGEHHVCHEGEYFRRRLPYEQSQKAE